MRRKIFVYLVCLALLVSAVFAALSFVELFQIERGVAEGNDQNFTFIKEYTEDALNALHYQLETDYAALLVHSFDDKLYDCEAMVDNMARYVAALYAGAAGGGAPDGVENCILMPGVLLEEVAAEYVMLDPFTTYLENVVVFRDEDGQTVEGAYPVFVTESGMLFVPGFDERKGKTYHTDVRQREWYTGAVQSGDIWWSDIYESSEGESGGLLITCSKPVYVQNRLVGVVSIDLDVGVLGRTLFVFASETLVDVGIINPDISVGYSLNESGALEAYVAANREDIEEFIDARHSNAYGLDLDGSQIGLLVPLDGTSLVFMMLFEYGDVLNASQDIVSAVAQNNADVQSGLRQSIRWYMGAFALVTLLVILAALLVARRSAARLTKPIEALVEKTKQVGAGNLDAQFDELQTGDEIEDIAHAFNQMTASLKDYIEHLASVTAEKKRVETELEVARLIQRSMLPNIFPPYPDRAEFDLHALMEPAREVGGDFYDFYMLDDRHLAVLIADVAGKGVGAALFMVISKVILKNCAGQSTSPAQILTCANTALCEKNDAQMFVTAFFGVLDVTTGQLRYANAGHNPPLLHSGAGTAFLPVLKGLPLAAMEGVTYREACVQLAPEDQLLLYTDGMTEAFNPAGDMFGDERLQQAFGGVCVQSAGLPQRTQALKAEIDSFAGEEPQADDITMLLLLYLGRQARKEDTP